MRAAHRRQCPRSPHRPTRAWQDSRFYACCPLCQRPTLRQSTIFSWGKYLIMNAKERIMERMPYVAGKFKKTSEHHTVFAPYDGKPVAEVFEAGQAEIEEAIAAAAASFAVTRKLSAYDRSQ